MEDIAESRGHPPIIPLVDDDAPLREVLTMGQRHVQVPLT